MKKFSRFIPLIILLIIIVLGALAIYNSSTKQNIIKEEIENLGSFKKLRYPIKLPEFAVIGVFDENNGLTIKDFKNEENRYSVVNFFASWCVTCAEEHESLFIFKNDKNINFYGIAWHDYSENAIKYLNQNGNPFEKVGLDGRGLFTRIVDLKSVPETMVVDPNGYVILKVQGAVNNEIVYQILNFIEKESKKK